ncbi:hypothetical protein DM860_010458 [Cuscuta australis]|uniref:Late embryogenesis abundant protein LEA-2 subgroup domain-containing protein n=1 Tax=Cuscuta australis TaxID=267555 RepID=A0A328E2L0_9ASTE|nr:hypothetical protein DM860_010458 [Cuscuta australis]
MKSNNVSPPDKEKTAAAAEGVLGYPAPKQPLNNPPLHRHHHQYPPTTNNHPLHAYAPPHPYPAAGGPHGVYPPNQYPSPTPNLPHHPGYNNNYTSTPLRPSPPPPPHLPEYEARRSFAFARVILCLMVFLILMTSVMSLLTYIVFGSDIPTFEVATFAVPSFNFTAAGNSTLTAAFEGGVAAENPNHKLDITLQHVEVGVGYRQLAVIAKKQIEPFELKRDARMVLKAAPLATPAGGFGDAGEIWLKDMKSEYDRDRSVTFDLMLTVVATFKSGSSWSRRTIFKVVCAGLKTEFKDPGGAGVWDGVKPACMVFG